jgi:hypothetical protein
VQNFANGYYMNIYFPQTLLHYFMPLQFKFDVYGKKIKWHIILKNSNIIETCINLNHIVQNNVFEVEKLK